MCVMSMVGDHYNEKWDDFKKFFPQNPLNPGFVPTHTTPLIVGVSQEEFDKLKAEVENMKKLMIRAKIYDEQNGEPNCEMEEKVKFLRQIAEAVGVNVDEVFGQKPTTNNEGGA